MAFGQNPLTGTQGALPSNQFPIPTVAVPGNTNGDQIALQGGPAATADSNGNVLAPASMYVYNGNDVAQGNTTDVAVVGDNAGTLSAKLRGLSKILNDMWDSTNHWLQVKVMNGNANGQATMANSSPVALASDQIVNGETYIQNALRNGKGFSATTGKLFSATNPNIIMGIGIYNASTAKTIIIYSIKLNLATAASATQINQTTADPAMGVTLTAANRKPGGASSIATVSAPANNLAASVTVIGTNTDQVYALASVPYQLLDGDYYILPNGANNGIAVYTTIATAGTSYSMTMKWIEV